MESVFDLIYSEAVGPQTHALWRTAYGDDYLEELDLLSFLTRSELQGFIADVQVRAGGLLVDLGCGRGGPGIAIATTTGAELVGIDTSRGAAASARAAAERAGLGQRARFVVASIQATGLADASADAALSVDVVQLVPDRLATFAEVARVLRPGARFCFTTWDVAPGGDVPGEPESIGDQRPLLAAAGFSIVRYEEPAGWRERTAGLYAEALAREPDLTEAGAIALAAEAEALAPMLARMRRVVCVAERC